MKKNFAFASIFGLLSLGLVTTFAAVTAINVGTQTGSLTSGTAGSSTYTVSFTSDTGTSSISGLSVSGLPAGATFAFSTTSSNADAGVTVPNVTLTVDTATTTPAGSTGFLVTSSAPVLSATGTLLISAAATSTASTTPVCTSGTFDTFTNGSVNGQGGWHVINTSLDQAVVDNTFGFPTFGCKSLRMSNASTSNAIFTQVFSPAASDAGELSALNNSGATGTPQNHFDAQFDLGSVTSVEQPGMHMSVSPDRGDGTRMSAINIADSAAGYDVFFDDFTGTTTPTTFNETPIATGLSRTTPHTIRISMDFVEGPSNDVVQVFIDGSLVHTGTSWENFYRFDSGATGGPTPNNSRTVNSLVFYEPFASSSANLGNGFLIDNVSFSSSATSTATTTPPASTSTLPIITLNGSSTIGIFLNSVFIDPGATAVDSASTSIPVTATGTVNTAVLGANIITYTATDSNNNTASTTRTVNVVSTSTPPVITLNGSSTMDVTINTAFTDPGATAVDAVGVSVPITATGTVNTAVLGANTITYTATDARNNVATTTRTVNVVAAPVTPPVVPVVSSGGGGGGGSSFSGGSFFVFSPQAGNQTPIGPTSISPVTINPATGQVLGVSAFNFTRNLKLGSTGNDVTELQKVLIASGDLILKTPTRLFGRLTRAALMKWQGRNGIPSTGFFGPISRAFLAR